MFRSTLPSAAEERSRLHGYRGMTSKPLSWIQVSLVEALLSNKNGTVCLLDTSTIKGTNGRGVWFAVSCTLKSAWGIIEVWTTTRFGHWNNLTPPSSCPCASSSTCSPRSLPFLSLALLSHIDCPPRLCTGHPIQPRPRACYLIFQTALSCANSADSPFNIEHITPLLSLTPLISTGANCTHISIGEEPHQRSFLAQRLPVHSILGRWQRNRPGLLHQHGYTMRVS